MANGSYECHINISWLDMQLVAMASVPVRGEAVEHLASSCHFTDKDGHFFPEMIEVAIPEDLQPSPAQGRTAEDEPARGGFCLYAPHGAGLGLCG